MAQKTTSLKTNDSLDTNGSYLDRQVDVPVRRPKNKIEDFRKGFISKKEGSQSQINDFSNQYQSFKSKNIDNSLNLNTINLEKEINQQDVVNEQDLPLSEIAEEQQKLLDFSMQATWEVSQQISELHEKYKSQSKARIASLLRNEYDSNIENLRKELQQITVKAIDKIISQTSSKLEVGEVAPSQIIASYVSQKSKESIDGLILSINSRVSKPSKERIPNQQVIKQAQVLLDKCPALKLWKPKWKATKDPKKIKQGYLARIEYRNDTNRKLERNETLEEWLYRVLKDSAILLPIPLALIRHINHDLGHAISMQKSQKSNFLNLT